MAYWIIRRTMTSSRTSTIKASDASTGTVVSYSALNIPAAVKWNQPQAWDPVSNALVNVNEWYIKPVSIRYQRKKYEIMNEAIGAVKWSATLYGGTASGT